MKFIKIATIAIIIAVFSTACVYDGAYAGHIETYGTIYDNRYRAHYDGTINGYRHHGRGFRNYYHHGNHIQFEFSTHGSYFRIEHESRGHYRRHHGYHRHCYYTIREDYDPHRNVRVQRRYRVCR